MLVEVINSCVVGTLNEEEALVVERMLLHAFLKLLHVPADASGEYCTHTSLCKTGLQSVDNEAVVLSRLDSTEHEQVLALVGDLLYLRIHLVPVFRRAVIGEIAAQRDYY